MMTVKLPSCPPRLTVALLVCAVFAGGCGKESESASAAESRMNDPAYVAQLQDVQQERNKIASKNRRTTDALQKLIASARANLPAGAKDEAVMAELEGHPEKYPQWKELNAALAAENTAFEENRQRAMRTVRARILQEAAAGKAAAVK